MRTLKLDYPELALLSVADKLELAGMLVSACHEHAPELQAIADDLDYRADTIRDREKEEENRK